MLLRVFSVLTILSCINIATEVQAQSLYGTSTTTGSTTGRTTSTTGTAGSVSSSLTGGNTGGTTTGRTGSTGNTRSTGGTNGLTNSRAGTLSLTEGTLNSNVQLGNFAGSGLQNGGTFVGGNVSGTNFQTNSRSEFSAFQNRGGNTGQFGQGNQNRSINQRTPVRPQFQIAFTVPPVPAQKIESSLTASVLKLPQLSYSNETITLNVDDKGVVTMSGTVNSEREKKLLEAFVSMEPGVRKIENELTVAEVAN